MNNIPEFLMAAAAAVTALSYLGAKVRRIWRVVSAAIRLVDHELQHNGGGSMKDHAAKAAEMATKAFEISEKNAESIQDFTARIARVEEWQSRHSRKGLFGG